MNCVYHRTSNRADISWRSHSTWQPPFAWELCVLSTLANVTVAALPAAQGDGLGGNGPVGTDRWEWWEKTYKEMG